MKILPVGEICTLHFDDGESSPCRIWEGELPDGTKIEAYVLSVVPMFSSSSPKTDAGAIRNFMQQHVTEVRSRDLSKKVIWIEDSDGRVI